jgi:AraC-like DNA-binding protein/effector-binding domain-containing protein
MQTVLAYVARNFDRDVALDALATRAGLSRFQFHRVFSYAMGETPAHLTTRLRLARAAVLLLTTKDSVLAIALACGFQSHETFCRAFRRRFEMTPGSYRRRGFAQTSIKSAGANRHAKAIHEIGPCLKLYRMELKSTSKDNAVSYTVSKKEIAPQPVLILSRRVRRSEIAATIAESLGRIFGHAQQHGIALAGLPFTRYTDMGPGLITMEPGMRIAPGEMTASPPDDSEVKIATLPGGFVAATLHSGSYEGLPDAYAAIQQWIEAEGLQIAGPPWESYLNDPSEHPDPSEWKTEVCWPVAG